MNPPFSATPGVDRIRHDADLRHLRSAFSMLPPGGRLAAITSAHCVPGDSAWRDAFAFLNGSVRVVFTMAIDGRAYARRGTGFDTRLTVLDRSDEPGITVDRDARAPHAAALLDAVIADVPPRLAIEPVPGADLFGHRLSPRRRSSAGTPRCIGGHRFRGFPLAEVGECPRSARRPDLYSRYLAIRIATVSRAHAPSIIASRHGTGRRSVSGKTSRQERDRRTA